MFLGVVLGAGDCCWCRLHPTPPPLGCWPSTLGAADEYITAILLAHCVVSPLEKKETGSGIGNVEAAQRAGKGFHLEQGGQGQPCGGGTVAFVGEVKK